MCYLIRQFLPKREGCFMITQKQKIMSGITKKADLMSKIILSQQI